MRPLVQRGGLKARFSHRHLGSEAKQGIRKFTQDKISRDTILRSANRFFRPAEPLDRALYTGNSTYFLNRQPIFSSGQTSHPGSS